MCAYHCEQLSYTTQHRAVSIIFPLILQLAHMIASCRLRFTQKFERLLRICWQNESRSGKAADVGANFVVCFRLSCKDQRRQLFCDSWPWPLTFWLQNKCIFSGLVVKRLCVKFGDPSCIDFWDIVRKNRQTDKRRWKPDPPSVWVIIIMSI